jgi:hypothetical protein
MELVQNLNRLPDALKSIRETRLSALRPPAEFFDYQRISRPKDTQEFMKRAGYNM